MTSDSDIISTSTPHKNKKNNESSQSTPDDTPYQDLGDYKEESIFHWYKGEAHKKNLKKHCFAGSDYMIDCPCDCASAVYNKFAKTTYFIFEEKEHAAKFLNAKYFHNGKSIELYGTIKYAEEAKEDLRKSKKNKISKTKDPEPESKADHTAEKNEVSKTAGMSQPILAKENLAVPTANKVDSPIIATKSAIPASVKSQNDSAKTPTKLATDRKITMPIDNLKDKKPTAAGKKIDLKGAIASAISTNNIPLESSDFDVDITGESENANSSGMDIDSSDVEVKKEPDSSQDGYHTQDSVYNE
ncbi:hypothetical protein AYI70_g10489 [Smittium culicis]|uniref:Uncharacterized protein n=1 Tax=Smittium culicis TaxID=133412 RepID=A0A1R1X6C8_9FUNG|nr:hypothetical protein AYI70_g10489 [Smittium culicis]